MASTPVDIIQLDKPKDSDVERNRKARWIVCIVSGLLTLLVPFWAFEYVGEVLNCPTIGGCIGYGIGVWLLGCLMPRMIIDDPEWSAYVTQDPFFGGSMVPYGPGAHPAFWWEERNEDGNYSLKVITRSFNLTSPTKSSALTVSGRLFYNASLRYLTNAIGVDREVVEEGQIAFIDSALITIMGGMESEEALKQVTEIGKKLNKDFRCTPALTATAATTPEEFERKFGYSTAAIVIDKITYPSKVQDTLNAVTEARKMNEISAELLGVSKAELAQMLKDKVITVAQVKEMLDRALVTSGNAKMNLNVIEGSMANAVANFLGKGGQS